MNSGLAFAYPTDEGGRQDSEPEAVKISSDDIEKTIEGYSIVRDVRDKLLIAMYIRCSQPPTDIAFDLSLRSGDKTWLVGPVAWAKGDWKSFSLEAELPIEIKKVDILLTPSSQAAEEVNKLEQQRVVPQDGIWMDSAIVFSDIAIKQGKTDIQPVPPISNERAIVYATAQLASSSPELQQLVSAGQLTEALRWLDQLPENRSHNVKYLYGKGCVQLAGGDLDSAHRSFYFAMQEQERSPSQPQNRDIERQLRRIYGRYAFMAENDDMAGVCGLGSMYEDGHYVEQDYGKAKRYYRTAANAGHPESMRRLATMYHKRRGAVENSPQAEQWYKTQADHWYSKAAALGDKASTYWETQKLYDAEQAVSPIWGEPTTDYQDWVNRYLATEQKQRIVHSHTPDGVAVPHKLIILSVTGDGQKSNRNTLLRYTKIDLRGFAISNAGHTAAIQISGRHTLPGYYSRIPATLDLKHVDKLIERLPDDQGKLPPFDRRVLVQTLTDGRPAAKVYDRANLPDTVLELLKLCRFNIAAWCPKFTPMSQINVCQDRGFGFLCLSPDQKQLLYTCGNNNRIQIYNIATREFVSEIPDPKNESRWGDIAFSPDGKLAALTYSNKCAILDTKTWTIFQTVTDGISRHVRFHTPSPKGMTSPRFTHDGNHLVVKYGDYLAVRRGNAHVLTFKVGTWQRVEKHPGRAANVDQYFPSPSGTRAVMKDDSGAILLLDTEQDCEIAKLEQGVERLSLSSFSPDGSMVATVATSDPSNRGDWSQYQIRVWNTTTGDLVQDMKPHGHRSDTKIHALCWTPDGQHLLAAKAIEYSTVGIVAFNARTGDYRGEFVGAAERILGMAIVPELGQVITGSYNGSIQFWDLQDAIKTMDELEVPFSP